MAKAVIPNELASSLSSLTPEDIGRDFQPFDDNKAIGGPVVHPRHYNSSPSGVECLEVVRWLPFNLGNAMKYIWRSGENGNAIQDLEKAAFYLQDEVQRLKNAA